jgi:hypothetical protein
MAGAGNLAASPLFLTMNKSSPTTRQSSMLFVILFMLAAAAISYWSLIREPDYITLRINGEWEVYLIGESNVYAVEYHTNHFKTLKQNSHMLSLQGFGDITWHQNHIRVHKAGVYFNKKLISKSRRDMLAHILFARDGTVRKGLMEAGSTQHQ